MPAAVAATAITLKGFRVGPKIRLEDSFTLEQELGSKLCPRNDFAKMEIAAFLHH
ncbi:hypothetical protein PIB30_024037 [Stylosanthes scabra]|uniref:Uncharacterized protein n=1 Tax=Stylosanthes scabra TaxID=79078 RepID=A0ABU6R9U2_9FABA|nr:hypothetical protein [Stylosanthes scabra]